MIRETTKSYAGRQVDLELLKHVDNPLMFTLPKEVTPNIDEPPRIVSGIEKAVQRYAKLFLTHIGSVKLAGDVGNTLLHSIGEGKVNNMAELNYQYAVANGNALGVLSREDSNAAFGEIPDDEHIVRTTLVDLELKRDPLAGGAVHVHVFIETAAGTGYTLVIPVAAGIS